MSSRQLLPILVVTLVVSCTLFTLSSCQLHQQAPRIITSPKSQVVVNERVASFICTAEGSPKPQIEWRKNGKRLVTLRYTVIDLPNGSILRVEPVRPGRDNATYECIAENGIGEPVRGQAELIVLSEDEVPRGFPRFITVPHMQGVEKGRTAVIPCRATGDPDPVVTWFKDMMPVDLSNPRYSIIQGASLQVLNTEESDQGHYECVAENSVGTEYSNPAALYVKCKYNGFSFLFFCPLFFLSLFHCVQGQAQQRLSSSSSCCLQRQGMLSKGPQELFFKEGG